MEEHAITATATTATTEESSSSSSSSSLSNGRRLIRQMSQHRSTRAAPPHISTQPPTVQDRRSKRTASVWRPLPDPAQDLENFEQATQQSIEPRRLKWDQKRGTYRISQKNIDHFFQNLLVDEPPQPQEPCRVGNDPSNKTEEIERKERERAGTLLRAFGHLLQEEPRRDGPSPTVSPSENTQQQNSEGFKRALSTTTATPLQVVGAKTASSILVGAARLTAKLPSPSSSLPSVRIASRRSRKYATVAAKKGKSVWSRVLPFFGKRWFPEFFKRTIKTPDQRYLAASAASPLQSIPLTTREHQHVPSSSSVPPVEPKKASASPKRFGGIKFGKKAGSNQHKGQQKRETTNSSMSIMIDNKNGEVHAGSVLTGRIELDLSHQINIRGVWLKIEGCDSCYWIGAASTCFSCSKPFLEHEILLDPTTFLPSGHSAFKFSYVVPSNCPASYRAGTMMEFKRGISYRISSILKGTNDKPKGPRATKFFTVLREGREVPAAPPRKRISELKKVSMKCTLNTSQIELGGELYITIEISNQSKSVISCVKVDMKEKHKQQVPAKHVLPMKAHHTLYSIVEEVSHESPPYQLTKKYKIPVLDERTWASVETPNKLFVCHHQIETTITIKGKSELKVKLPITVLPVIVRHSDGVFGSNNDRSADGPSTINCFESNDTSDSSLSSPHVLYKTCHSLLQSPELRPPTNNEACSSFSLVRIPPLNKM